MSFEIATHVEKAWGDIKKQWFSHHSWVVPGLIGVMAGSPKHNQNKTEGRKNGEARMEGHHANKETTKRTRNRALNAPDSFVLPPGGWLHAKSQH